MNGKFIRGKNELVRRVPNILAVIAMTCKGQEYLHSICRALGEKNRYHTCIGTLIIIPLLAAAVEVKEDQRINSIHQRS